jgi:hypothetical protein
MVVRRLVLLLVIGLIGSAGCNREPLEAPVTQTPAVKADTGEAALPSAVAADGDPKSTRPRARDGVANRPRVPLDSVAREPAGDRLFPLQAPQEGDQKKALLLFLLGLQQSRRAEAP